MSPNAQKRTAAILGAGLGTRLISHTHAKPLLSVGGQTLLNRLILQLAQQRFERIVVVLRDELLSESDKASLMRPRGVEYIFVNTPSSLHTLGEAVKAANLGAGEPLFVSMVDTVLKPDDLTAYCTYCSLLGPGISAVLGTRFIDDEKPLYVQVDSNNFVSEFGATPSLVATSGMYYLSAEAQAAVGPALNSGMEKMRNFLSSLIKAEHAVKLFVVDKSLDVDRPEDLAQAERFI